MPGVRCHAAPGSVEQPMEEAQRLASTVVSQVLAGRSLDSALAKLWREHPSLSAQQRGQVQDLCFGALRFHGYLETLLDALVDKPVREEKLACLMRVALYQLEFTRAAAHTVVDQAVLACARFGCASAKGLINAVLRSFLRRFTEQGSTVLLASHILAEVAQTVDRVVVIDRGRLRASGSLAKLTEQGRTLEEVYLELTGGGAP